LRLWIDTDVGDDPDDAVALLCAARHPGIDLIGVSTVGGDVEWRAGQARSLVPGVAVVPGPRARAVADADAALFIGPWTHAAALGRASCLPERVACMGGSFGPVAHRGVQETEHNVGSDVAAARELLQSVSGVLVVPLEVTARMTCTRAEEEAITNAHSRLAPMVERWRVLHGDVPLCLHDPLALLALYGDAGIETAARAIAVDGMGRLVEGDDGVEHEVVVDADRDTVVARVLALLNDWG
jgi:inosine-uridine nucleoside N-ribohydrolase